MPQPPLLHLMSMAYFGKSHSQGERGKVNLGHQDDVRLKKVQNSSEIRKKIEFHKKGPFLVQIGQLL